MISFELAKQLKDAGFPQEVQERIIAYNENMTEIVIGNEIVGQLIGEVKNLYDSPENRENVYVPSLSELIDACGEKFYELKRVGDRYFATDGISKIGYSNLFYRNPDEAVAQLYLEINKCEACDKKDGRMHTCTKFR